MTRIAPLLVLLVVALAGCSGPTVITEPTEAPVVEPLPDVVLTNADLNGTYVVVITADDLAATGVTDPELVEQQAGTWTWTLEDGRFEYLQESDAEIELPEGSGRYEVEIDTYIHSWSDEEGAFTVATVAVLPDGSLSFSDIEDGDPQYQGVSEALFGAHPWERVGEP